MFRKIFQALLLSPTERRYDRAYSEAVTLLERSGWIVTTSETSLPHGTGTRTYQRIEARRTDEAPAALEANRVRNADVPRRAKG